MRMVFLIATVFLSGCGIGDFWMNGDPSVGRNLKPHGAHWIKEGMTRESRAADWSYCGGGEKGAIGYKDWLSGVPYEIYAQGESAHIKNTSICMRAKGYSWLEECDARCLHP
jgi:hypothetical protein